jgi:hypothetical protein
MTAPSSLTNAEVAQHIARALGPVLPLCYARNSACACSGRYDRDLGKLVPHNGHDVAKAPISKLARNGVYDATRNSATIDRNWRQEPDAGIGLDLEAAGLIFIDPDSPAAYAEAVAQGVEGGMLRSSRNDGFLFKRPADSPIINITKAADGTDLEIRTTGYVVVWNTHQDGSPVRIDLSSTPIDTPRWAVERLKRKATEKAAQDAVRAARRAERATSGTGSEPPVRLHQRGQRRWNGELVQRKENGEIDHSDSLYFIGLDLAECGASEAGVRWAVENRDVELGWRKYADRDDADERYSEIAEKVVAYVVNREHEPQIQITKPVDVPDDVAALRAALEAAEAENVRLRRSNLDRDDRLEVLEPIVTQIDEIIARPEEEIAPDGSKIRNGPTSDDKLVAITLARWMPYYRNKRKANGEPETISLKYLSKVMGMPARRISKSLDRLSSDDPNAGAPYQKVRHRVAHWDDQGKPIINPKTGKQLFTTPIEVRPWREAVADSLRAAATYVMPARPKHGGSEKASAVRWGRCPSTKHDNHEVRIKGYCPKCGQIVGERIVTLSEFDALNVQVGHSEGPPPTVSSSTPIAGGFGHSDRAYDRPKRLNVQVVDSDLARAATMVALDDGREIDRHKRVGTKAPVDFEAIREARERAAAPDPPDWLDEWPDRDQVPAPPPPPPRCVTMGCEAPAANGYVCAGHLRGDRFEPSPDWQVLPDGYPCPPGGEYRMDFETGKNWARWPSQGGAAS